MKKPNTKIEIKKAASHRMIIDIDYATLEKIVSKAKKANMKLKPFIESIIETHAEK